MTGFGKVTAELPSKKVTVEIKALNSKQLDLSTRIPSIYKEKEMQIRSLLLQSLERGKVEFNILSVKTRPHRSTWLREKTITIKSKILPTA